jgi:hypothetical protein
VNIYARKQRWKMGLAAAALLIVMVSFWYSSNLVQQIKQNEKQAKPKKLNFLLKLHENSAKEMIFRAIRMFHSC